MKRLDPKNIETAELLDKANAFYDQRKHDKAKEFAEKALSISLKARGPEHPDVATAYHTLGKIHANESFYPDKAIEYTEKALVIRLQTLGPDHPDVAMSYNNLRAE